LSAAEDYLLLGLRLGKHVDGLVDSYYGPQDLKDAVDDEPPVHAAELAQDAAKLRDSLPDGWLRDQVSSCEAAARVFAGAGLSYSDEVEACYGVRPERTPESVYEQVHAELDELLPGDGSLFERRQAWKKRHLCPGDKAVEACRDLLPVLRARTKTVVELPVGEDLAIEPVTGEPWWAFNYYQGNLQSRVVINTDVPTSGIDLIHLVAHEVYPGHHTEHAVKEQLLARDRGAIEESIQLVCTPQAVLSEGIATMGEELILDESSREEAYAVVRRHGVELPDPELAQRIEKALEPMRSVGVNAALMIHEDGMPEDEVRAYVERWNLVPPKEAQHTIDFVTDPTWRAYTITYSAGRDLCRRYTGGDLGRFRTLLTEHVRIGELLSA
jgi:hypothetical protein